MQNYVGLDIGTTKITAVLYDVESGSVHAVATGVNTAAVPPSRGDGIVSEQDTRKILEIAYHVLAELVGKSDGATVKGIGLTGQMHGLQMVDSNGAPVHNLITWQDKRCDPQIDTTGITYIERIQDLLA